MTTDSRSIQHVVLMRFPQPLDETDDAWLRSQVAEWPSRIGGFLECRVGSDLTGVRSQGWHYLLHTTFADAIALKAYIDHPVHQEFVAFLVERECDRLAFDYHY